MWWQTCTCRLPADGKIQKFFLRCFSYSNLEFFEIPKQTNACLGSKENEASFLKCPRSIHIFHATCEHSNFRWNSRNRVRLFVHLLQMSRPLLFVVLKCYIFRVCCLVRGQSHSMFVESILPGTEIDRPNIRRYPKNGMLICLQTLHQR